MEQLIACAIKYRIVRRDVATSQPPYRSFLYFRDSADPSLR